MLRRLSVATALLGALALPLDAGAQAQGATPGTSGNFDLVGHNALFNRGMNAAPAIYHNYMYIGNRTDASDGHAHPGILVLDISRSARPEVIGELPPPAPGLTARELRVWPQQNLLMVMIFGCSPLLHDCANTPERRTWRIDFYDLTGANARQPKLLHTYVPSRRPHEMYLWLDPKRPGRALLYQSTPTGSTNPDVPNLLVTDISRARDGVFTEVAKGNWNHLYTAEERERWGPALHSMSVSEDGTRTHLAYLGGTYLVVDSSDLANATPNPQLRLLTPPENRPTWPNNTAHSAIPLPGRPFAVTTDELYGDLLTPLDPFNVHGCPWGWAHVIDFSDPARPRVVGEYRTEANTDAFCQTPAGQDDERASYTAHNPTVYSDLAFISWHSSGLQAFSVANPSRPTQTGWFTPTPLGAVATEDPALSRTGNKVVMWSFPIVKNGLIYVVDVRNGLYVLRYSGTGARKVDRTIFLEGNSNLDESCPVATVSRRTVRLGRRTTVTVHVRLFEQPVRNALVTVRGAGVDRRATTGLAGRVKMNIRAAKPGMIRVRVPNVAKLCVQRIAVRGVPARPKPRLTGSR